MAAGKLGRSRAAMGPEVAEPAARLVPIGQWGWRLGRCREPRGDPWPALADGASWPGSLSLRKLPILAQYGGNEKPDVRDRN